MPPEPHGNKHVLHWFDMPEERATTDEKADRIALGGVRRTYYFG
jgi:hypothetical protein